MLKTAHRVRLCGTGASRLDRVNHAINVIRAANECWGMVSRHPPPIEQAEEATTVDSSASRRMLCRQSRGSLEPRTSGFWGT